MGLLSKRKARLAAERERQARIRQSSEETLATLQAEVGKMQSVSERLTDVAERLEGAVTK